MMFALYFMLLAMIIWNSSDWSDKFKKQQDVIDGLEQDIEELYNLIRTLKEKK